MEENKNIHYSAKDIARYHSGQMTPAERHALEKAALDDPFLADAIEGYAFSKAPGKELAALKNALAEKTQQKRGDIVALPRRNYALRIAALFILLAGLGWLVLKLSVKDPVNDIATVTPVKKPDVTVNQPGASPQVSSDSSPSLHSKPAATETTVARTYTTGTKNQGTAGSGELASGTQTKSVQVEESRNDLAVSRKQEKAAETESVTADVVQIQEAKAPAANRAAADGFIGRNHEIRGVVKNDSGQPVPFASISLEAAYNKTNVTDKMGFFKIMVPDTNAVVTVTAAGFDSEKATVNYRTDNEIVLKDNNASLKEVVVTGHAQGRKKSPTKMIIESGDLEPEVGWIQYNEYVETNLKKASDEKLKSKKRGEVALAFDVNEAGEPVNITVVRSQCEECNEKAIKLLKEGPKWKSRQGKKGKISFRF